MSPLATPAQLATNSMAATEHVSAPAPPADRPSTAALRALAAATETALHHVDPKDADRDGIDLLAAWHDVLSALKTDVSGMLRDRGAVAASGVGLVELFRDLLGGHGLKAMVSDGTRLLDRLHDTMNALADAKAAATLGRHRAIVVDLVNRAQDRLDT